MQAGACILLEEFWVNAQSKSGLGCLPQKPSSHLS